MHHKTQVSHCIVVVIVAIDIMETGKSLEKKNSININMLPELWPIWILAMIVSDGTILTDNVYTV